MASILVPNRDGGGFVHGDAPALDRKLREGDGIAWPGDPRLWLGMGIIEHKATKKVGRRYEVWRDMEDGSTQLIGHWRLEEFDRILLDLCGMRAEAPGHVPVADLLDKADKAMHKADSDAFREAAGPMIEHQMALAQELENGKMKHYQVGGGTTEQTESDSDYQAKP